MVKIILVKKNRSTNEEKEFYGGIENIALVKNIKEHREG